MRPIRLFAALLALVPGMLAAAETLHHELSVKILAATVEITVTDVITLPPSEEAGTRRFILQNGLTIVNAEPAVRRLASGGEDGAAEYVVTLAPNQRRLVLNYRGKINLPPEQIHSGFGRNQEASGGTVSANGVYLDGASAWYPVFGDELLRFAMDVEMPSGWRAVSQGTRSRREADGARVNERWQENEPQEEIYLVAAPFHEFRQDGKVEKLVMLRESDAALAEKYLGVMDQYIDFYSRLIGPYPYGKFALVENSWESGYGMPSFTLLGPRVIRLPFILHGSFPHEILHNWWGNGVYVDGRGNWFEGLTAYLADHLLQERNGTGAAYRRDALLRYANYVAEQADFPLSQFRMRHSDASQAVGYYKALMFFHALRLQLGDRPFIDALRRFYREKAFQRAGWEDLRRAFEHEAKLPLKAEFDQWLQRPGAPALRVTSARAEREGDGYELVLSLQQTQPTPAYRLRIPVAVTVAGQKETVDRVLAMDDKQLTARVPLAERPWRVHVDPEFDVIRRLDSAELPPTLSEALAAERMLIVLPAAAPPSRREAYRKLAAMWSEGADGVSVVADDELKSVPEDRAVWLFGWENRFLGDVRTALAGQDAGLKDDGLELGGRRYARAEQAIVLAARRNGQALVWLGSDNPAAVPGLARKLPHYGSASYLAFRGDEPTNVLKGQWQVLNSPLVVDVAQPDSAAAPAAVGAARKARPPLAGLIEER